MTVGSQLWRILHEAGVRFTHHMTWKASSDQNAAIRAYLRHDRNTRSSRAWRLNAEVHHSLPNVAA